MATTSMERTAGTPARDLRWERWLRAAALATALAAAPMLAPDAAAQRSGAIQASAFVTASVLGARMQPDSVAVAVTSAPRPAVRQLRVEGVGMLLLQTAPGEVVLVTSRMAATPDGAIRIIQLSYLTN
jgi:hypothetical protein